MMWQALTTLRTLGGIVFLLANVPGCACATGGDVTRGGAGGVSADSAGAGGSGQSGHSPSDAAGAENPLDPTLEPWKYYDEPLEHGYKDPALGDDVRDQFAGAVTSSGRPDIRYPLSGSMHAMNLPRVTFQWLLRDAPQTLFRVEATAGGETYFFFVPCDADQCAYEMPRDEWLTLGYEFAGKGNITFRVSGTAGAGAPVATSAPIEISFSPEAVRGALYYWASAERGIKRAHFGSDHAVPFIVPNTETNEYACAGCHSVSRDGQVIAFAVAPEGGENIAGIQTAPTESPHRPYVAPRAGATPFPARLTNGNARGPVEHLGHNVALSPDGKYAAVNGVAANAEGWPPFFEIRNTRSGETLVRHELYDPLFGAERLPILPEWSPDGTQIAVALADASADDSQFGCLWTSDTCRSSIAILDFDGATLSAPTVLVPASDGDYHFYPTWSPDGAYIAFASGKLEMAVKNAQGGVQKSQSNPNAILRLVPTTDGPHSCPGPRCYDLENGMQYTVNDALNHRGQQSTWPKFTPFAQGPDKSVMFISFNTKVDYGFLSHGENQIWMFALDVSGLGSEDPSKAPVWLPYQDVTDGSLTPYWTETLPCNMDPEGGCAGCVAGEICEINQSTNECHCVGVVR